MLKATMLPEAMPVIRVLRAEHTESQICKPNYLQTLWNTYFLGLQCINHCTFPWNWDILWGLCKITAPLLIIQYSLLSPLTWPSFPNNSSLSEWHPVCFTSGHVRGPWHGCLRHSLDRCKAVWSRTPATPPQPRYHLLSPSSVRRYSTGLPGERKRG